MIAHPVLVQPNLVAKAWDAAEAGHPSHAEFKQVAAGLAHSGLELEYVNEAPSRVRRRTYPAAYCDGLTTTANRRPGGPAPPPRPRVRRAGLHAGRRPDFRVRRERMAQPHQLGRLRQREERRLGLDRRRVALGGPGGRESLGQRHAEVDPCSEGSGTRS
jgi:hypothetical protein